jgi:hypothetical protein
MSFTSFAQVKIKAVWVHALETDGVDGLGASVAGCKVGNAEVATTAEVVSWLCDFYKRVSRVLFIRYAEARHAGVKIWAIKTFITITIDPGVAQVTNSEMNDRLFRSN